MPCAHRDDQVSDYRHIIHPQAIKSFQRSTMTLLNKRQEQVFWINLPCLHAAGSALCQAERLIGCCSQAIRWFLRAGTPRAHTKLLRKSFRNQVLNKLALPALLPWIASRREFLKLLLALFTQIKMLPVLLRWFLTQTNLTSSMYTIMTQL
jgi:hypothetical protein